MADATCLKARGGHRVASKAPMVAMGPAPAGRKEVVGSGPCDTESEETWAGCLLSLRGRGLRGMRMPASDAHDGLVAALGAVWPGVAWRRRQAHFARDIAEAAPKGPGAGLRPGLAEMLNVCSQIKVDTVGSRFSTLYARTCRPAPIKPNLTEASVSSQKGRKEHDQHVHR